MMKQSLFFLRRPVVFLVTGALLFFCLATGFLYEEKRHLKEQNRSLIIQNDSVMSVNIELADSLRNKAFPPSKNAAVVLKSPTK